MFIQYSDIFGAIRAIIISDFDKNVATGEQLHEMGCLSCLSLPVADIRLKRILGPRALIRVQELGFSGSIAAELHLCQAVPEEGWGMGEAEGM